MEKIISKNFEVDGSQKIDTYRSTGGYKGLEKALSMSPSDVISWVKESGLRGRGGAGFPTGVKWGFVPQDTGKPVYLCVNADEGEPGTFKDREILLNEPHTMIEGILIAAYALRCQTVYVYMRGEFSKEKSIFLDALSEAKNMNLLDPRGSNGKKINIYLHMGAGAYICGEETALLESLEGKRGFPRIKPPFPAVEGLFKCPTIVNNVETLAYLPSILGKGAKWFRKWGTEKAPGMRLFAVSGHVQSPGVYELPLDISLMTLIRDHAGGLFPGKRLKAVIPGGASSSVLRADESIPHTL